MVSSDSAHESPINSHLLQDPEVSLKSWTLKRPRRRTTKSAQTKCACLPRTRKKKAFWLAELRSKRRSLLGQFGGDWVSMSRLLFVVVLVVLVLVICADDPTQIDSAAAFGLTMCPSTVLYQYYGTELATYSPTSGQSCPTTDAPRQQVFTVARSMLYLCSDTCVDGGCTGFWQDACT